MNIYLVKRLLYVGYDDECDSFVAIAESPDAAKKMKPGGDHWPVDPADVKATHLGTALPGAQVGIVHRSYNAG